MRKKFKIIVKIWRFVLVFGCLVILSWLFVRNLVLSGEFAAERDFCHFSRVISDFYPKERTGPIEKNNRICWQTIFSEPVYFAAKMPRTFENVFLLIKLESEYEPISIGLRTSDGWEWNLKPLINSNKKESKEKDYSLFFDRILYHTPQRELEFIISAPGLFLAGQEIKVAKILVKAQGRPLTSQELAFKVINYLQKGWRRK